VHHHAHPPMIHAHPHYPDLHHRHGHDRRTVSAEQRVPSS
jgi:hypothetical protein